MQKLIVIRHGRYGADDRLSDDGKQQMKAIATKFKPYINGKTVVLLSSTAARATDSADVVTAELGIPAYEQHEVLWSDCDHFEDFAAATELLEKHANTEVVILVTHLEYAEDYPAHYVENVLQGNSMEVPRDCAKGRAIVLDCKSKTAQLI